MAHDTYSMKSAAKAAGIGYETLRYYCKMGLVPHTRNYNNYRVFSDEDIAWVRGLTCLRSCGMGIEDMRHFMELVTAGDETVGERLAIITHQRQKVEEKIKRLHEARDYLIHKQDMYERILTTAAAESE